MRHLSGIDVAIGVVVDVDMLLGNIVAGNMEVIRYLRHDSGSVDVIGCSGWRCSRG